MTEISALLGKLEDPFVMFPLQGVARILTDSIVRENEAPFSAPWGDDSWGTKYISDAEWHRIQTVELLIGSAFVLGQAAITQSVAITRSLALYGWYEDWIPYNKNEILDTEAMKHAATGKSEIILIDAVANYFKHHDEWPPEWDPANAGKPLPRGTRETIENVRQLGLSPHAYGNLSIAARKLGDGTDGINWLADRIQSWRERLAQHLREKFAEHGFS